MPVALHPRTLELLDDLPPYEADSYDVQGVLDVLVRELERIDDARDTLVRNFFPQTADEYLTLFEELLRTTVNPEGRTTLQRQQAILAMMRRIAISGSGQDWQTVLTSFIGTNWTYEEHNPADGGSPPAWTVRIDLPFANALLAPTGLSATPAAGGTLPNATYYYRVTAVAEDGETNAGAEVSAASSGSNHRINLAWTAVTGALSYNVYRGTASNAELLIANSLTNSYSDMGAAAGTQPYPTTNRSESYQGAQVKRLIRQITPAHLALDFGDADTGFIFGQSQFGDEF